MTAEFLRHFLIFVPGFAFISIGLDFVRGQEWPPVFVNEAASALTAGLIYAALMVLWQSRAKEKGDEDDQGN